MLSFVTGISSGLLPIPHYIANLISISCLLIGYAAVFSSAMLYHVTLRLFWKLSRTSIKFYGTSFILGLTISLAILSFSSQNTEMKGWLGLLLINIMGIKLALDVKAILHTRDLEFTPSKQSALIMLKKAGRITAARFLFGLIGGILLPISGLSFNWPIILCFVIFVCCLFAELAERILFFKAVDAPKMPGGISV
jgi:DMSO reductase anchor subunit